MLPQGTEVMITQSLGGSYTLLVPSYGGLFRLSDRDADAIGREKRSAGESGGGPSHAEALTGEGLEREVWQTLKTCYDPEIPVNIWDLGLIYDITIVNEAVSIKMTLTAVGCSLGPQLVSEVETKMMSVDGIENCKVEMVWSPPWSPERLSDDGRLSLQAMGFPV